MFTELKRIYASRNVIRYIIWKEIKTSHRDKLLGNLWSLLDPLLMMLVLFFVFQRIRNATPVFTLYLFTGLIAWEIFSKCLVGSSLCLKRYKPYIHKFPLPLSIFPTAIVLHKLNDFAWGFAAFLLIYLALRWATTYSLPVPAAVALLPVWIVGYLALTLGLCLILARIGVFFNDVADITAILLRIGFFINPVFIDMSHIAPRFHELYFLLNPVAGYLIYFRLVMPGGGALIENYTIPVPYYPLVLLAWTAGLLVIGWWSFARGSKHYTKYI
jgi:ABC-type polysaccharide/polyol phosphate export permease